MIPLKNDNQIVLINILMIWTLEIDFYGKLNKMKIDDNLKTFGVLFLQIKIAITLNLNSY